MTEKYKCPYPGCGRLVKIKKDGTLPKHTPDVRRAYHRRSGGRWKDSLCPLSGQDKGECNLIEAAG